MILQGVRTAMRSDFRRSVKPDNMRDHYPVVGRSGQLHSDIVLTIRKRAASNPVRVFVKLSADLKQIDAMAAFVGIGRPLAKASNFATMRNIGPTRPDRQ
jgi:hypothetical protein